MQRKEDRLIQLNGTRTTIQIFLPLKVIITANIRPIIITIGNKVLVVNSVKMPVWKFMKADGNSYAAGTINKNDVQVLK